RRPAAFRNRRQWSSRSPRCLLHLKFLQNRVGSIGRAAQIGVAMRALPFLLLGAVVCSPAMAQQIDWQKVDDTFGRKPAVSGDVHRYGFPRSDLSVTLDGVTIKPALALGGWVAFKPAHGGVMVMGDLVLLESE